MKIYEIADAEAQLGLLRTIIDSTWAAIAQQAAQQKQADAERKEQAKLMPRGKKASKGSNIRIPTTPPTLPIKPQAPTEVQPSSPLNKPKPNDLDAAKPLPTTNTQLKPLTTIKSVQPKLAAITSIASPKIEPKKHQSMPITATLDQNLGAIKKGDDVDDRHSKVVANTLQRTTTEDTIFSSVVLTALEAQIILDRRNEKKVTKHSLKSAPSVSMKDTPKRKRHEPGGGAVIPTRSEPGRPSLGDDRDPAYPFVSVPGRCPGVS